MASLLYLSIFFSLLFFNGLQIQYLKRASHERRIALGTFCKHYSPWLLFKLFMRGEQVDSDIVMWFTWENVQCWRMNNISIIVMGEDGRAKWNADTFILWSFNWNFVNCKFKCYEDGKYFWKSSCLRKSLCLYQRIYKLEEKNTRTTISFYFFYNLKIPFENSLNIQFPENPKINKFMMGTNTRAQTTEFTSCSSIQIIENENCMYVQNNIQYAFKWKYSSFIYLSFKSTLDCAYLSILTFTDESIISVHLWKQ